MPIKKHVLYDGPPLSLQSRTNWKFKQTLSFLYSSGIDFIFRLTEQTRSKSIILEMYDFNGLNACIYMYIYICYLDYKIYLD